MDRRNQPLHTPTFAQTVVVIQTMPLADQHDLEAIKLRHLALGFHYHNDQIHRALRALRPAPRQWSHTNRRSARST